MTRSQGAGAAFRWGLRPGPKPWGWRHAPALVGVVVGEVLALVLGPRAAMLVEHGGNADLLFMVLRPSAERTRPLRMSMQRAAEDAWKYVACVVCVGDRPCNPLSAQTDLEYRRI